MMHCIKLHLMCKFCLENDIRAIVLGKNKNWKQNCNLGHHNNQILFKCLSQRLVIASNTKQKRMAYL